MIQKGQARWVSGSDVRRQMQFINKLFGSSSRTSEEDVHVDNTQDVM